MLGVSDSANFGIFDCFDTFHHEQVLRNSIAFLISEPYSRDTKCLNEARAHRFLPLLTSGLFRRDALTNGQLIWSGYCSGNVPVRRVGFVGLLMVGGDRGVVMRRQGKGSLDRGFEQRENA